MKKGVIILLILLFVSLGFGIWNSATDVSQNRQTQPGKQVLSEKNSTQSVSKELPVYADKAR